MSNNKYYDASFLLEMMDGNEAEIKELAQMLIDLGPKMITTIGEAIKEDDWDKAGKEAHKLKSSLKLWQMNELAAYAFFIESKAESMQELDAIKQNFELLKQGFQQALDAMRVEYSD